MLPTKGYFQDIECPYFNSSCGRPYCHFRHRKKQAEYIEEVVKETEKESPAVPTYKPTPKSELANIHNNKSHIPISYVPDLTFRPDRKSRPILKFEKPTYKPTPLSILSSANKRDRSISEECSENFEAIKEIKQNIANVEYDPTISLQTTADINFEDLSTEFDLIDEIINSSNKVSKNSDEAKLYDLDVNKVRSTGTILETKTTTLDEKKFIKDHPRKGDLVNSENKPLPGKSTECDLKPVETNLKDKRSKPHNKFEKGDKTTISDFKNENIKLGNKEQKTKKGEKHEKKEGKHDSKGEKREKIDSFKKNSSKSNKEKLDKVLSSEHVTSGNKRKILDRHSSVRNEVKEKNDKPKKTKHGHEGNPKENITINKSEEKKEQKPFKKEYHRSSREKQKNKGDKTRSEKSEDSRTEDEKIKKKSKEKHKDISKSVDRLNDEHEKKAHSHSTSKELNKQEKKRTKERKNKHHSTERKRENESKNKQSHDKSPLNDKYQEVTIEAKLSDHHENPPEFVSLDCSRSISPNSEVDDNETMLECYRIFNEYIPPKNTNPEKVDEYVPMPFYEPANNIGKKRIAHGNTEQSQTFQKLFSPTKSKTIITPGQTLANRYKISKAAQASKEQELVMNEMHLSRPLKRTAPSLLEAARERKIRRETIQQSQSKSSCLVDDILKGTSNTTCSQVKIVTRIAPAQNVSLMAKAKERISKIKQTVTVKTVAQTQKGNRTAHVPDVSLSDIPDVLQSDKSKLPVNVRTRFLTMIADECVKLYISKEEAYARALNEEYSCYEKCKVLTTYRNSAMLAVNRLRKEIQERNKSGLGLIGLEDSSDKDTSLTTKSQTFYNNVKKWLLTEEELDLHGYPRLSEEHYGRAIIKNVRNPIPQNLDENQRICARCHKIYQVDDDGWPLFEEECCYHPLRKRTIRGEQTYLCCRSNEGTGCATSDTHVSESANSEELEGYQTTLDPEYADDSRSYAVYALDCEMCYTTKGLELTRVTVVDTDCKTVYESLVKPLNPIIDYNTRFSGITKEQMDKTSTSILQIQANILHLCNSKTILVGHSLESDMKALKIVHKSIIDTAILFPHKMGLPHKRALKVLASEYLRKIIQNDVSGHDSAEDATTCMDLLKWKLKDECKGRS